jgi:hypothetical protein
VSWCCLALVLLAGAVYATAPGRGQERFVDQVVNREAVDSMRNGAGYYDAMTASLQHNTDRPDSPRAFREPLAFVAWRYLPSAKARWLAFVVLAMAAGTATALTSTTPIAGPAVSLLLLRAGRPTAGSVWIDQHLLVEIWTGAAIVLSLAAWRTGRTRLAAGLAGVAVLLRELAVPILIGGIWRPAASGDGDRARRPWLVVAAVAALAVAVHFALAWAHVSPSGSQEMLLGTGGPRRVLDMAGVGLPRRALAGAVLWALAWWRVRGDGALIRYVGPLMLLPLLGLVVGRDYWGFAVTPLLLILSIEAVSTQLGRRLRLPGRSPLGAAT